MFASAGGKLTDQQIANIDAWVKQGMRRGDERLMPKLPAFAAEGWQLGKPLYVAEDGSFVLGSGVCGATTVTYRLSLHE